MSTRWLHELAIPGRPDISSVYACYSFASVVGLGLLLAHLTHFWPWFSLALLATGFQIPLVIGIALAKFRTALPQPVGHARMYPDPEPLKAVGWLRAFGGFLASITVIGLYALYVNAFAV
jgi:hypothetical protein